jgi:hypothetical protein
VIVQEAATWKLVCLPCRIRIPRGAGLNRQNWFSRAGARVLLPIRAAQGELVAVGE